MNVYAINLLFINLLIKSSCDKWPPLDDFSLRVRTETNSNLLDDFHVDFYVSEFSKESTEDNLIVVTKFQLPDGKHITEGYDVLRGIRVVKIILLGQIANGQSPFQQYCFITKLGQQTDLLPADAIRRLRQKNPLAVRLAEEDRGTESTSYTYFIPLRHLPYSWSVVALKICDRTDGAYLSNDAYEDLDSTNGITFIEHRNSSTLPKCTDFELIKERCECLIKYCMPWYPCGWKFCDENHLQLMPNSSSNATYRCGVQSCRSRHVLKFQAIKPSQGRPLCDSDTNGDIC